MNPLGRQAVEGALARAMERGDLRGWWVVDGTWRVLPAGSAGTLAFNDDEIAAFCCGLLTASSRDREEA